MTEYDKISKENFTGKLNFDVSLDNYQVYEVKK